MNRDDARPLLRSATEAMKERSVRRDAAEEPGQRSRYAAFISYRHVEPDRTWAKWLHHALETYRVPSKLSAGQRLGARIGRVFRDEEEFAASSDLKEAIQEALEESRFLIVVCSPRTPASKWVNREVERFRELGRAGKVLALLIEGEPAESFPEALTTIRRAVVEAPSRSREEIETIEPLAADVRALSGLRPQSRTALKQTARLRLVACILGVRYDDLRQRDHERRTRRLALVSLLLAFLLVVIGGLGLEALVQRNEAVYQRGEAERIARNERELRRKYQQQSARTSFERAYDKCVSEGPSHGLLWLARNLGEAIDAEDPALERSVRNQIAAWKGGVNCLEAVFDAAGPDVDVAFSPDGHTALTAEFRGTILLWDAATGDARGPRLKFDGQVTYPRLSADGKHVFAVGGNTRLCVWEASTGRLLDAPVAVSQSAVALDASPDGRTLAVLGNDGKLRLLNTATFEAIGDPIEAYGSSFSHVVFSADGNTIAVSGEPDAQPPSRPGDFDVRIWNLKKSPVERLGGTIRVNNVMDLAVSGVPGYVLAATGGYKVGAWDSGSGKSIGHIEFEEIASAVAFSPDGNGFAIGGGTQSSSGLVRLGQLRPGEMHATPLVHRGYVKSVRFSHDGSRVLTGSRDGTARLWRLNKGTRQVWAARPHESQINSIALSADGSKVLTASDDGTAVQSRAADGSRVGPPLELPSAVECAGYSSDSAQVWTSHRQQPNILQRVLKRPETLTGLVRFWDARTGKRQGAELRREGDSVTAGAFAPGGKRLIAAGGNDLGFRGDVWIWDLVSGKTVGSPRQLDLPVASLALSPDGKRVVVGTRLPASAGSMYYLDVGTWADVIPPIEHASGVSAVAFSPAGAAFATGGPDRSARLWNPSGTPLGPPLEHEVSVWALAFSPDSSVLLSGGGTEAIIMRGGSGGGGSGMAYLWDVSTGKVLGRELPTGLAVTAAAFASDGRRFLTGDVEGKLRLWEPPAPFVGSPEEAVLSAQLATGLDLDASGAVRTLDAVEWRKRRARLSVLEAMHNRSEVSGRAAKPTIINPANSPLDPLARPPRSGHPAR
jgi:WD40 repeat protein